MKLPKLTLPLAIIIAAIIVGLAIMLKPKVKPWSYYKAYQRSHYTKDGKLLLPSQR